MLFTVNASCSISTVPTTLFYSRTTLFNSTRLVYKDNDVQHQRAVYWSRLKLGKLLVETSTYSLWVLASGSRRSNWLTTCTILCPKNLLSWSADHAHESAQLMCNLSKTFLQWTPRLSSNFNRHVFYVLLLLVGRVSVAQSNLSNIIWWACCYMSLLLAKHWLTPWVSRVRCGCGCSTRWRQLTNFLFGNIYSLAVWNLGRVQCGGLV